jgi:hypothetical protein
MPLFKRVDQLPAATGVTGTDFLILSRPSGPTGTVGTRAVTLSQILALATGGAASTVSVAGPFYSISPTTMVVEECLMAIDGVLANKADSAPATTDTLGQIRVGTGLGIESGTLSVSYGTSGTTACVGNDARLSDARTPTSHTHGNLTNSGAIGSSSGQIVVTTTSGVLTTAATISASAVSGLAAVATSGSGSDITTGTVSAARLGAHASTHQTGGADAVSSVVVTPSSLAADQNDWAIGTGDVFRVAGTAARNITGIAAGTSGLAILLVNVGSFALTLKHASTSSTAANRFTVPWAGDCILAASGGNAVLVYDSTTATWRVL